MLCGNKLRDYGFVAYLINSGKQVYLNEDGKTFSYLGSDLTNGYNYYKIHYKSLIDELSKIKKEIYQKVSPKM
jgi:hypothetical protein